MLFDIIYFFYYILFDILFDIVYFFYYGKLNPKFILFVFKPDTDYFLFNGGLMFLIDVCV